MTTCATRLGIMQITLHLHELTPHKQCSICTASTLSSSLFCICPIIQRTAMYPTNDKGNSVDSMKSAANTERMQNVIDVGDKEHLHLRAVTLISFPH